MFQLFVILFVITLYIKDIFKEIPLSVKNIIAFLSNLLASFPETNVCTYY